jgi:hypothetical protein
MEGSGWSPGIYTVRLTEGGRSVTAHVVLMKRAAARPGATRASRRPAASGHAGLRLGMCPVCASRVGVTDVAREPIVRGARGGAPDARGGEAHGAEAARRAGERARAGGAPRSNERYALTVAMVPLTKAE